MKTQVEESNERWRNGVNEKLVKIDEEIRQLRNGMKELKEKGVPQVTGNEELRKGVEELKRWREEMGNNETGRGHHTGSQLEHSTAQPTRQEQKNWKELE